MKLFQVALALMIGLGLAGSKVIFANEHKAVDEQKSMDDHKAIDDKKMDNKDVKKDDMDKTDKKEEKEMEE